MKVEVLIACDGWTESLPDAELLVVEAADEVPSSDEAAVLLADDLTVRDLNARFRSKDAATNVLAFPAPATSAQQGGVVHAGDVIVAFEICAAEAAAQGKPLADHLRHLIVHGLLHLAGHDHEDKAEAEAMEALERTVLARLGVPDPYSNPALAPVPDADGQNPQPAPC